MQRAAVRVSRRRPVVSQQVSSLRSEAAGAADLDGPADHDAVRPDALANFGAAHGPARRRADDAPFDDAALDAIAVGADPEPEFLGRRGAHASGGARAHESGKHGDPQHMTHVFPSSHQKLIRQTTRGHRGRSPFGHRGAGVARQFR
jgi:hypothetical protein